MARAVKLRQTTKGDRSRELTQLRAEQRKLEKDVRRLIEAIVIGALSPSPQVRAAHDELESGLGRVCALIATKEKSEEADVRKLGHEELQERCAILRKRLRNAAVQTKKR